MAGAKWLDGYSGQTVDELIALAADYRIDSIVLAFEEALQRKTDVNEAELTILAVEALEREVNNGGHHQFFLNTPEYTPHIVEALRRIDCPRTASVTASAISLLHSDPGADLVERLIDGCDRPYDDTGEAIADRLFDYIRANRASISLA